MLWGSGLAEGVVFMGALRDGLCRLNILGRVEGLRASSGF